MGSITIKITAPDGHVISQNRYDTPVTIGREQGGSIVLETDDLRVSRRHAQIVSEAGRLLLRDQSINGTGVNGRHIHGADAVISNAGHIDIYGFLLDVHIGEERADAQARVQGSGSPAHRACGEFGLIVHPRTDLRAELLHHQFASDTGLIVNVGADEVRFKTISLAEGADPDDFVDRTALVFYLAEATPAVAMVANSPGATIAIDCEPEDLSDGAGVLLEPATIVTVAGRYWIGIIAASANHIACGNPNCQVLNDYKPEQRCRRCGWDLTGGGGSTQIAMRK